jgi:dihydropteroate synthase
VRDTLAQGRAMVAAGADILDVGAESTRPRQAYGDRPEVGAATELAMAIPVVAALVAELGDRALISIDTSKGIVASAAVDAGAGMVNDVWAAQRDPGTADAAARAGTSLVLMHNQEGDAYPDGVYPTVLAWLRRAVEAAVGRGVDHRRLLIDPGIGFGKGTAENLELLHRLGELKRDVGDLPVVVGTSRKRFLGELLDGAPPEERLEGTLATAALAVAGGADVVRVHDVGPVARTLRVADAVVRR